MNAVIYARFSTDKQDARSLDDQIRRCTEHAKRSGMSISGIYSDAAMSGATTDRPEFQRLLSDVKNSKGRAFNCVLVDDLSRLSRDLFAMGKVVFSDLARHNVRVVDVMTGTASDSAAGRQVFTAMGQSADLFLQMVKAETHRGLEGRALGGFWTGGRVYGYRSTPELNPPDPEHPRKLLVIDEGEAVVVRRIFEMHADEKGYAKIADLLNQDGIPAPYDRGTYKKKVGRGWQASSIRSILGNERYAGSFTWNKRKFVRGGDSRVRNAQNRDPSEWKTQARPELAIITPEAFAAAQKRLTSRKGRTFGSTGMRAKQHHLLSGTAVCGKCGAGLGVIGQRTKNGVRYVTMGCSAHYSRGAAICPMRTTISERKLNELVIGSMEKLLLGPGAVKKFIQQFEAQVKTGRKAVVVDNTSAEIATAERTIANLTDALGRVGYSEAIGTALKAQEATLSQLKGRQAQVPPTPKAMVVPTAKVLGAYLTGMFETFEKDPEQGRRMLRAHFEANPPKLSPKKEGSNHVMHAVGAFELALSPEEQNYSERRFAGARSASCRVTVALDASIPIKGSTSKRKVAA